MKTKQEKYMDAYILADKEEKLREPIEKVDLNPKDRASYVEEVK